MRIRDIRPDGHHGRGGYPTVSEWEELIDELRGLVGNNSSIVSDLEDAYQDDKEKGMKLLGETVARLRSRGLT